MMTKMVVFGLGFSIGSFGREVVRIAYSHYMAWRFNRDFHLAQERLANCKHEKFIMTDCGMGLITPKCINCLALKIPSINGIEEWSANSASLKEAVTLTRKLQKNKP